MARHPGASLDQDSSAPCKVRPGARQRDVAARHGHRHGVGPGLDPVRQHGVRRAAQAGDPLDFDRRGPAPLIRAPILVRQSARSTTSGSRAALRITVCPCASTAAIRAVCGAADRDLRKLDLGALQAARRLGNHISGFDVDLRAEAFQHHQQQVDRPRADRAAAGQRHPCLLPFGPEEAQSPRSSPASWTRDRKARWCRRCARPADARSGRRCPAGRGACH